MNSWMMESFDLSSASLSISMISEAVCFFFPLLTLAGSLSSLLTSSICEEVPARALVHGCWGGFCGQSQLRCPCFLQVKYLPAFMSLVRSSASILLALAQPVVVSMALELLFLLLFLLLFQAIFHCSGVCSFLRDFKLEFPVFTPRAEWISKYFCWYFCATLVQSSYVWMLVLLMIEAYSPAFRPLPNWSSTIWSWRL